MLNSILSNRNYLMINVTLINRIGLQEAVYLTELLNYDCSDDGIVIIDRDKICERTSIKEKDQLVIDKKLYSLGVILSVENDIKIKLDFSAISTIITCEDKDTLTNISRVKQVAINKRNKNEAYLDSLKKYINPTTPELTAAYYDWISSVQSKTGWLSKETVLEAQRTVDMFSKGDNAVAIEVVKLSSSRGYRDMRWAIKIYNEIHTQATTVNTNIFDGGASFGRRTI